MTDKPVPPSAWYLAVNVPLGYCWGIGLPAGLGIALHWPTWLIIGVTLAWYVLNLRVIDRYLPVVSNPVIEWVYRLFHRG